MLPIVRTFISLPAGVARMPFWRFSVLTVLGCLPWVFMLTFIGQQVGDHWEDWKDSLHYFDYAVAAAIVIGVVYLVVKQPPGEGRSRSSPWPDAVRPARARRCWAPLHGPAELVPVSSSAHVALVPWLLGLAARARPRRGARSSRCCCTPGRASPWRWVLRREALAALRRARRAPGRARTSLALGIPSAVGLVARGGRSRSGWARPGRRRARARRGRACCCSRPTPCPRGRATAVGRRAGRRRSCSASRRPRRWRPGVSRRGATLAAARLRGYSRGGGERRCRGRSRCPCSRRPRR